MNLIVRIIFFLERCKVQQMIVASKQFPSHHQQHKGRRIGLCLFVLWLLTVLTLLHCTYIELCTLKAQSQLLRSMTQGTSQQPAKEQNLYLSFLSSNDPGTHTSPTNDTMVRLWEVLRPVTNDRDIPNAQTPTRDVTENPIVDVDMRGHLFLHIGPSKTGTTSLQTDLTSAFNLGWLGVDHYYAGRYYQPYYHNRTSIMKMNRSESALLETARTMRIMKDGNCSDFRRELDELYYEKREVASTNVSATALSKPFFLNVIVSDEGLGNIWLDQSDYKAIYDAIHDVWQVTMVVGYRHFHEFLVSTKFQRDRADKLGSLTKENWLSEGGRSVVPIFPDTMREWRNYFHFTDELIENVGSTFPVRILNLHDDEDNSSLTTKFLCEILDSADYACQRSRERDAYQKTFLNTQADATVVSPFYDVLATTAASAGLIDESKFARKQIREAARVFQEETLGLTANDLPLLCPTRKELEELFNLSLDMESKHMPRKQTESDNADFMDFRDGFEAKVAEHAYCFVDAGSVLTDLQWKQFFERFSAKE